MDENMVPMEEYNAVRHNMEHFLDTVTEYMDKNKELEQELERILRREQFTLRSIFEELKEIRSKLLYGDDPAYVVEDKVQELIWRVGHYIGEF